jgi:hypothetical protein
MMYVRATEEDPNVAIPPGAEEELPRSPEGETIVEVVHEEP